MKDKQAEAVAAFIQLLEQECENLGEPITFRQKLAMSKALALWKSSE